MPENEKKKAAISVVIPVYNVKPYLCECLDSVVNQTFTDLEIIIVDDGSTDGSGKICDEYAKKDSRIQVIHKENGGLGNARNVGMDAANGKYIVFLDSDDYWDLSAMERLFYEAEKNSVQVLVFSAEPFFDGIKKLDHYLHYGHSIQNEFVKNGAESMKTAIENKEYFSSACLRLYLLNYLREKRMRFDEGIVHEDEKMSFLAYLLADRVECIGDRLYKRRYRRGSIMTSENVQKSAHGYITAIDGIMNAFCELCLSNSQKSLIEYYVRFLFGKIRSMYAKVYCEKNQGNRMVYKGINKDAKRIMRRIRIFKKDMSFHEKVSTYNLCFGVWGKRINKRIKRKT